MSALRSALTAASAAAMTSILASASIIFLTSASIISESLLATCRFLSDYPTSKSFRDSSRSHLSEDVSVENTLATPTRVPDIVCVHLVESGGLDGRDDLGSLGNQVMHCK